MVAVYESPSIISRGEGEEGVERRRGMLSVLPHGSCHNPQMNLAGKAKGAAEAIWMRPSLMQGGRLAVVQVERRVKEETERQRLKDGG